MTMKNLILIILSSAFPPVALLAYVATRDRPTFFRLRYITFAFVVGMNGAMVGFFIFEGLGLMSPYNEIILGRITDDLALAIFALCVVGPIEETLKFMCAYFSAKKILHHIRPEDCAVIVSASALGFAFSENWYAMWALGEPDPGRCAIVPFAHLIFSSPTAWGLMYDVKYNRDKYIYLGLVLSAVYHGIYDFLVFKGGIWYFFNMPIILLLWIFLTKLIHKKK